MAHTINKYPLTLTPEMQPVQMPTGAKVLAAGEEWGLLCCWAQGDPTAPKVPLTVRVIKDAANFSIEPTGWRHVDTVKMPQPTPGAAAPVYHVFVK